MEERLRLEFHEALREQRRGRRHRGKHVAAFRPEDVGEATAVGMPGRVDALRVDRVAFLQIGEHGVEELQVAIALRAGHDDRLGPFLVDGHAARRLVH